MTSRPRIATDANFVNGIAAVALFAVLAFVFWTTGFAAPQGFGEESITASIGYAMFDLLGQIPEEHGETEGFLVAFITIAVVLDAALDGALMLARREEEGGLVSALADGGERSGPARRSDGGRRRDGGDD